MGWRDINMSRRKPQRIYAAVPREAGEDHGRAVLRKAVSDAVLALRQQMGSREFPDTAPDFVVFAAGYLAGFARQAALRLGVDAEAADADDERVFLLNEIAKASPMGIAQSVSGIGFAPRDGAASPRSRLKLVPENCMADAGYLTGQLEFACGSRKLLRKAHERLSRRDAEAGTGFLLDCDIAADPMQTRAPTLNLRFNPVERAIIVSAFACK